MVTESSITELKPAQAPVVAQTQAVSQTPVQVKKQPTPVAAIQVSKSTSNHVEVESHETTPSEVTSVNNDPSVLPSQQA